MTLINSVLSSMPLYTLSIYKLPDHVIKHIDRFLWQGTVKTRKKYALVNCQVACFAKDTGGLGILDLKQMNIALLMKWWWKFQQHDYHSLWKTQIIEKYYSGLRISFSPFWKVIMSLETLGKCSVIHSPRSQSTLKFWTDTWANQLALNVLYPQLYDMCANKSVTLSEVVHSQGAVVKFRRHFD